MCMVMRLTRVPSLVELVGVGHQGDRLEELREVLVLGGHPGQLGDVLDPAVGLVAVLGLELGHVPAARGHRLDQVAGREGDRQPRQGLEQLGQRGGPLERLAGRARPPRPGRAPRGW